MPSKSETAKPRDSADRGFVLLVVLSALGLLALVAATFTQIARTHVKAAATAGESARAEALADAGVHLAVLDLVAAREAHTPSHRFALNAAPVSCSMGADGAVLTIAVQDEAGRVDLNIATEPLLRALVLGAGVDAGEAAVDAILDFRDEDDDRRPMGAERSEYRAAGRSYGPKNGPFLAIEELAGVLGLNQVDMDRLRPFVTIYSGQPAVDVAAAPQALVDTIVRGVDRGGVTSVTRARPADGAMTSRRATPLPAEFLAASTRRAFSIRSAARTPAGAMFVREAIVEFATGHPEAFTLRRWYRAAASPGHDALAAASPNLSPC